MRRDKEHEQIMCQTCMTPSSYLDLDMICEYSRPTLAATLANMDHGELEIKQD